MAVSASPSSTASATPSELERIPERAAGAVLDALVRVQREQYMYFLGCMYHYTLGSGDKARTAAEASSESDLVQFFQRMEREEGAHHLLARDDLLALGGRLDPDPPPAVCRFDAAWRSLASRGCFAYLGAVYVFEHTGEYLRDVATQTLGRLRLERDQTRWVRTHLKADVEHGAAVGALCRRYFQMAGAEILHGARVGERAWVDVFRAAFEGPPEAVRGAAS